MKWEKKGPGYSVMMAGRLKLWALRVRYQLHVMIAPKFACVFVFWETSRTASLFKPRSKVLSKGSLIMSVITMMIIIIIAVNIKCLPSVRHGSNCFTYINSSNITALQGVILA